MFEPTKNDGYYQLGLEAAAVIRQAIANRRPVVDDTIVKSTTPGQAKTPNAGREQQSNSGAGDNADLLL
jgi:hypothetical protein